MASTQKALNQLPSTYMDHLKFIDVKPLILDYSTCEMLCDKRAQSGDLHEPSASLDLFYKVNSPT